MTNQEFELMIDKKNDILLQELLENGNARIIGQEAEMGCFITTNYEIIVENHPRRFSIYEQPGEYPKWYKE